MSDVNKFEAHYLAEGVMGGKALAAAQCVLASDYDRDTQALKAEIASLIEARDNRVHQRLAVIDNLETERDAHRAQVEAMRIAVSGYLQALDNGEGEYEVRRVRHKMRQSVASLKAKP